MSNFKPMVDEAEQIKLITELKQLKKLKKMTLQQIADKTKENGEEVSLSTIKLVFSDEVRHQHDYTNTLVPIFNALCPVSENDDIVVKTLRTKLEIKLEIIEQLKSNIKQLEERLDAKDLKHKDREKFYIGMINDLREEIAFKNEQIRHHNEAMDRKDATLKELYDKLLKE